MEFKALMGSDVRCDVSGRVGIDESAALALILLYEEAGAEGRSGDVSRGRSAQDFEPLRSFETESVSIQKSCRINYYKSMKKKLINAGGIFFRN